MKKLITILFAWMLVQAPLCAENIMVNNINRNYIVYAPKNLGSQRPLLISCTTPGIYIQKQILKNGQFNSHLIMIKK